MSDILSDDDFLAAFLDTLIPPGGTMPGAGALGLGEEIRAQLADNAMLAAPVSAELSALQAAAREQNDGGLAALDADGREALLGSVMAEQPILGMFQLFVFMAYYRQPEALRGLGLPGTAPFPNGHEIQATDESLLKKLRY